MEIEERIAWTKEAAIRVLEQCLHDIDAFRKDRKKNRRYGEQLVLWIHEKESTDNWQTRAGAILRLPHLSFSDLCFLLGGNERTGRQHLLTLLDFSPAEMSCLLAAPRPILTDHEASGTMLLVPPEQLTCRGSLCPGVCRILGKKSKPWRVFRWQNGYPIHVGFFRSETAAMNALRKQQEPVYFEREEKVERLAL